MARMGLAVCLIAGGLALVAAAPPSLLAQAQAGLWEIRGVPGAKAPVLRCLADLSLLAQFEHRGKACSPRVISHRGNPEVVDYSCGAAGFGRSQIDLITPRSLRIDTQGISDQLPFHYVLQAHRIGECPPSATASRH